MVKKRFVLAMALAAGLAAGLAQAQAPPTDSGAVIRVETREVPVDVMVAAKNGTPTRGLTAKDFSVWEDGKPQKINSVTGAAEDPETMLKHFVLYFDFSTMPVADQTASERAAAEFVAAMASPDRYMAVASLGTGGARVLQDFTPARAALERAVNAPLSVFQQRSNAVESNPQMKELADSLVAVANSMAPAQGRKAVLLFTDGAMLGNRDYFKTVITACNRANVALFAITGSAASTAPGIDMQNPHASPLPPKPGTVPLRDDLSADSTSLARFLAEGSGGEALSLTSSLKDKLAEVARQQDEYYRVFYTPPASREGVCHVLRVAVDARGAEVRARDEYCTEKQVDVVAGKIAGEGLESRAASAGAGSGGFEMSMEAPYFYAGTNRAVVHLSVELTPAGMKFAKDQTGLHGQIDMVGTAVRTDGGTAARFADSKNIDVASQAGADAFVKSPYRYEKQFTVAAGSYDFQLAMGAGANAVGKANVALKVDPLDAANFGMGSIAFSTEMHAVDPALAVAPMLESEGPLVAGGKVFVPSARNRFARSQTVYFYTEVYDPALGVGGVPASPSLAMEYRIVDRKTGEVKMDTGMARVGNYVRPGNPVVPFATRLPVGQLPAGDYRLEVRAAGSAAESAARSAEFAVE